MTATLLHRLIGAATLDSATYEEIEADRHATPQALAVVVFSSLAAAIGARGSQGGPETLAFFAAGTGIALLSWVAFALLTFEVGAHLLPTADTRADAGQLLRTLGFAATPGLIQVFALVPGARVPVFTIAVAWAIAASVVAVRQALDYTSTRRAIGVCALAALLVAAIAAVLGILCGVTLSGS